jgi:hypothetical protein
MGITTKIYFQQPPKVVAEKMRQFSSATAESYFIFDKNCQKIGFIFG